MHPTSIRNFPLLSVSLFSSRRRSIHVGWRSTCSRCTHNSIENRTCECDHCALNGWHFVESDTDSIGFFLKRRRFTPHTLVAHQNGTSLRPDLYFPTVARFVSFQRTSYLPSWHIYLLFNSFARRCSLWAHTHTHTTFTVVFYVRWLPRAVDRVFTL